MKRLSSSASNSKALLISTWLICGPAVYAADNKATPLSDLPLELIGTYVTEPATSSFAIISLKDATEDLFKLEEKITGKVTLHEIRTDEILINNAGTIEAVKLTETTGNNPAAALPLPVFSTETSPEVVTDDPSPEVIPQALATLPRNTEEVQQYHLQPFDKLYISVKDEPDLTMWQTINESGSINYSYLGGLEVAGLTKQETLDLIIARLEGGYLSDPVVDISVANNNSFSIDGEVVNPGNYELTPGLTLKGAINTAGGLTERAAREKIALTRIVNNDKQVYRAGMLDLIEPGDFIEIKEGFF